MAFMRPEYVDSVFFEVEHDCGEGTLVPGDCFDPAKPLECVDGSEYEDHREVAGWFCHLSAPGYLDQTAWEGPFETEQEAMDYLAETYDVCPQCGGDFKDDSSPPACEECSFEWRDPGARYEYRNGDPISLVYSGCDGCSPSMINGVLCHEHGCLEAWRDAEQGESDE